MKLLFLFAITLFFSFTGYAQNDHKFVKLKEVKKGKRLSLYAENTDSISYDVFLKVETKDYRRSSNRPIIRTIAAKTKVKLLTLIQLAKTEGTYKSMFVVNEVAYAIEVDKDNEGLNFKLDKAIKDKKVILYTRDDCLICPDVKRILDNNKIGFTEYNIDKDSTNYLKIIKEFQNDKENRLTNRIPMLKVEDQVFNTITSLDDFVNALRQAFN